MKKDINNIYNDKKISLRLRILTLIRDKTICNDSYINTLEIKQIINTKSNSSVAATVYKLVEEDLIIKNIKYIRKCYKISEKGIELLKKYDL